MVVDLANPDAREFLPKLFQAVGPNGVIWGCRVALVAAQGKTRQLRAARSWGTESTPDRPFGVEGLTKSEEARVQAANAVTPQPKF